MLRLSQTQAAAFSSLLDSQSVSNEDKTKFAPCKESSQVPLNLMRDLHNLLKSLKNEGDTKVSSLYDIVRGGSVVFPEKKKVTVTDPALIARREYLMMKQEERQYRRMVSNVQEHQNRRLMQNDMATMKQQMGIGVNIIWAAFSAFFIGFFLSKQVTQDETHFINMVCGLLCAIGMLVVETVLFLTRAVSYEKYADKKPKAAPLFGKKALPNDEDERQECAIL